jgi:hypothetical protein
MIPILAAVALLALIVEIRMHKYYDKENQKQIISPAVIGVIMHELWEKQI